MQMLAVAAGVALGSVGVPSSPAEGRAKMDLGACL